MSKLKLIILFSYSLLLSPLICIASELHLNAMSPEAYKRTNLQNFKDIVLGRCIAKAYRGDKSASSDAGSSASALIDWAYFDLNETEAVHNLIDKYLSRDYFNPYAEFDKEVKYDYLKCLDLYHSKDLKRLAKEIVYDPNETYKSSSRNYYRDLNRKK
ncbi:T6SS amidase immunity protein Tai4 family protein [Snodgrassella alvi]|uniref:T6SS amidase immunity protein Tai4 family protein n=1 Tax=Snodgrassella alvi TaxID=1196083 RepID=UPI003D066026